MTAGAALPADRPKRIQLRRTAGWRKPEGAIVVARPSRWGNPWRIVPVNDPHFPFGQAVDLYNADRSRFAGRLHPESGRGAAVDMYRLHLGEHPDLVAAIRVELAGHDLACWCPLDQPCHADVLLELANGDAR